MAAVNFKKSNTSEGSSRQSIQKTEASEDILRMEGHFADRYVLFLNKRFETIFKVVINSVRNMF